MLPEVTKDEIRAMLVKSLMLKMPPEEITDDLPLFDVDGLGLDSIDALELVVSLEKNFGVGIPNSDVAKVALRSVDSLHEYVNAERAAKT
ncbi:MAG TPA: phosphopantetheine-binding protein [Chthoniobacterales bacterium]